MFLGLSTYSFPWNIRIEDKTRNNNFSFNKMFELAANYGITYFQFGDNYPLQHLKSEDLSAIQNHATEKNIKLQTGTRRLDFEHVKHYLYISEKFNSPFLRIVMDDGSYQPSQTDAVKIIRRLLPVLKDKGIILAIENHDRFKAVSLVDIIESTDPEYVGICLDTANSLGRGEGINELLPLLLPYTVNLHLKDFVVERKEHKMGFIVSGSPAGEGMLDIPQLISACSKNERCSTATLELWMEKENTKEETIKKEMEWVNKSIKYLKPLIL